MRLLSVRLRAVLRLVNGDRKVELQPGFRFLDGLEQIRMALGIEAVGGLEQAQPEIFGVIRLCPRRGKPVPQLTLLRFEVVPQFKVIRQRFEIGVRRVHAYWRSLNRRRCSRSKEQVPGGNSELV